MGLRGREEKVKDMSEAKTSNRNAHGTRVAVTFLKGDAEAARPMEGVEKIKVVAVETGAEVSIELRTLSAAVAMQILAHGAGVLLRNKINTNPNAEEASDNLVELAAAWEAGSFYPDGTRTMGTPDILKAMDNAFAAAGKSEAFRTQKMDEYMAKWNADFADEKKRDANRRAIRKMLSGAPAIKAELLALQAARAKPAKVVQDLDLDAI